MASMNMNTNSEYKAARLNNFEGIALTDRTYNAAIGFTVLWGAVINACMSMFLQRSILSMNYIVVLLVYFIGTIGCSLIVHKTNNVAVGFAAFTGMAASMGLLLTFYVYAFTSTSVAYALTGLVTIIMILLSMLYPNFFLSLGRTLFVSLLVCIIMQTIVGLVFHLPMRAMDYVVSLIFCGFIGYDWSRSQMYPKTANNAISCASDIYLDCVNIFIRILSISGNRRSN